MNTNLAIYTDRILEIGAIFDLIRTPREIDPDRLLLVVAIGTERAILLEREVRKDAEAAGWSGEYPPKGEINLVF